MSRVDATVSRAIYEIEIDHNTNLPTGMKLTILTGVKSGDGKKKNKSLETNKEHVAFHLNYSFQQFNEVAKFDIPKEAQKLLR